MNILPLAYPELYAVVGGSVPDFQGLFLRGVGGSSAGLGQAQGDAIRNIYGEIKGSLYRVTYGSAGTGALARGTQDYIEATSDGGWASVYGFSFDASRVVPTASENRPVNKAVRYLIKAKP